MARVPDIASDRQHGHQMKAYASRTGTRRNLDALRTAGWGLFVSAAGVHRDEGFRFVIDNGAWTSYRLGEPWAPGRFEQLLGSHASSERCEGIVAPDVVCGGAASLRLSLDWLPRLLDIGPMVYLPVQPGVTPSDLHGVIGPRIGVFVGGESEWKEATAQLWARVAHEAAAVCHVGRVNSLRRLMICKAAGADSFDGSGPSRFEKHLHEMQAAREVMVQLGLRITIEAFVIFDDNSFALVQIDLTARFDAILLAAEADRDEVIEVQTDGGFYHRERDFTFASWEAGL